MAEDTDGSIISDGMVDISDPTEDVAWVATEVTGFHHVHFRLFETVTTWMQEDNVAYHPFYRKRHNAMIQGLDALITWQHVARILHLASIQDYITLMNEFPRVQERFEIIWNYFDDTI
jgi:hypothetical protein